MDMTPLLMTLNSWGDEHHVVVQQHDDWVELTWQSSSGESCFISVYPEADDVVVLQHGMYASTFRQQQGVSRTRCTELPSRLTQLKQKAEQTPLQTWVYAPHIEIGTVKSLKLH